MASVRQLWQKFFPGKHPQRKSPLLLTIGLGASVIAASAYLLFTSPILSPAADELFPGQNLRFYAESAAIECSPSLRLKAPELCQRQEEVVSAIVGDFPQRIAGFADQIALAAYAGSEAAGRPIIALRLTNSREAERYLRETGGFATAEQETVEGVPVFLFREPQSRAVFFWRGWLFFAPDKTFVSQLIAVRDSQTAAARSSELVASLEGTMPAGSDLRIFADTTALAPRLPAAFMPLSQFIPRVGLTARQTGDKLLFELFAEAPDMPRAAANTPSTALRGLIEALPADDLAAMAAIHDFARQFELAMAYFERQDPAFALSVRGEAKKAIAALFGEGISLDTDLLPLLQNEVVLTASKTADAQKLSFALAAETGDSEFLQSKQQKLKTAFKNAAARFVPRILEHTLEDGTVITEVAACDDCVKSTDEPVGKGTLTRFEASGQGEEKRFLALGSLDGALVAADRMETVRAFLDNRQKMGQKTPLFLLEIDDFDRLAEILVLRPQQFGSAFLPALAWLKAFETVVVTRADSEDGFYLTAQAYFLN